MTHDNSLQSATFLDGTTAGELLWQSGDPSNGAATELLLSSGRMADATLSLSKFFCETKPAGKNWNISYKALACVSLTKDFFETVEQLLSSSGARIHKTSELNVSDYSLESEKRLILTGKTQTKLFVDGHYYGTRRWWQYPFAVDISARSEVRQVGWKVQYG